MTVTRILIVAGSDSGGGAGIQADIKTVTLLGGHAMTAITAITAQNTLGVTAVHAIPADMVIAQIDAVAGDIGVDAVKIGMIGSAEIAERVAERLDQADLAGVPLVFDPVMIATSGSRLADAATIAAFGRLMRRAAVSTPNLDELGALSGAALTDVADVAGAAAGLIGKGSGPILATGSRFVPEELTDLLFMGDGDVPSRRWSAGWIDTIHDHGTGCTLASGIATGLGQGLPLGDAIGRARDFVRAALLAAPGLGRGHGPMGHRSID
ncbi:MULTISPECIES: bifunctional hydroxymethylpyrimidine kinase/phosphomethylpyrimidine kinase [unclassified Sphingomonas]|uniref:bifunctional hydroxymethylpyrimidine kinase/phosphomethylpyrimidine kinase n=1 Tax=unclassified Sphingomonas TaxID=196159 RepID=UPI0006FB19B9|nr:MULTISPECIES: bifunctional hydroxymethylpyrimidine kinase/phosphomethylpyrimidine kinase [unclassified Sphingomonas]KQX20184.1 hydroxymethylpyrimidine/phosphomethylpyrimidine kinase [Sphingomonas sp. Root1294]KQY67434.1 hydroxymethylpyrimidine/phosphomethylpyrimidine kinase [Sphingomonas sp. Root50]KRB90810.1 hydroxymethylpyrimidine/phosphomethylpyrimidine kinase [Sphingomonas sp. Root720]